MGYHYDLVAARGRPTMSQQEGYWGKADSLEFEAVPGWQAYLGKAGSNDTLLADAIWDRSLLKACDETGSQNAAVTRAQVVDLCNEMPDNWAVENVRALLQRHPDAEWFVLTGG
jgi:hypothetical protein